MNKSLIRISGYVQKNSPVIMTGLGIAGVVSTAVFAVKATPRALELIEDAQREKEGLDALTKIEVIKVSWKPYTPAIIMGGLTIACILSAHQIHARRNTALAGIYSLTENRLREYQRQVVNTVGEKKAGEIKDAIAKEEVKSNPISNDMKIPGTGSMLCYESLSGRYFKSDVEAIKSAFNQLNRNIILNNYMATYLNDFYDEIGLSSTIIGDQLAWQLDDGEISPLFSSQLTSNNEPCLVVTFSVEPRANITPY